MNDMNSVDDIELYKKLWNGLEVVAVNGKKRVTCKYMYRDDINVTFAPANSNIREADGRTKRLITQLRKKSPQALKDFQEQIYKKIELGTLDFGLNLRHDY